MDKKVVMWIVIAVLAIAVIYMLVKTGNSGGTAQAISSASQAAASQPSSSAMVGGC